MKISLIYTTFASVALGSFFSNETNATGATNVTKFVAKRDFFDSDFGLPTTLITIWAGHSSTNDEATYATANSNTTTNSAAVAKTTYGVASSSNTATNTGRGTYYTPSADNCGTSSSSSDYVVAIAQTLYNTDANSESISGYCGKTITAHYGGNSVQVKVVDSCESCSDNDLDFSPAAFAKLADLDIGEIEITWSFD